MIQRSDDTLYVQPLPSHLTEHAKGGQMDTPPTHIVVKRSPVDKIKHKNFISSRGRFVLSWTHFSEPWTINDNIVNRGTGYETLP